jgi:transposase
LTSATREAWQAWRSVEAVSGASSRRGRRWQQRRRRLRPAELVAEYTAGSTARELAEQFGILRTTVVAHLERQGVTGPQRRGLQPAEILEAARLYADGWSAAQVSKNFGVSNHTVSAALRKAGVRIRSRAPRPSAERSRASAPPVPTKTLRKHFDRWATKS